jgi:hypothetical protein
MFFFGLYHHVRQGVRGGNSMCVRPRNTTPACTAPLLGGSEVSHRIRSKYNGIFIHENNTKNTYKIASFPIVSTLTLTL